MRRNKSKSALKLGNASTIVHNKEIRQRFVFCYMPDGSSYYWLNGMELTKEELDEQYPIEPLRKATKGQIIDHRAKHIYL